MIETEAAAASPIAGGGTGRDFLPGGGGAAASPSATAAAASPNAPASVEESAKLDALVTTLSSSPPQEQRPQQPPPPPPPPLPALPHPAGVSLTGSGCSDENNGGSANGALAAAAAASSGSASSSGAAQNATNARTFSTVSYGNLNPGDSNNKAVPGATTATTTGNGSAAAPVHAATMAAGDAAAGAAAAAVATKSSGGGSGGGKPPAGRRSGAGAAAGGSPKAAGSHHSATASSSSPRQSAAHHHVGDITNGGEGAAAAAAAVSQSSAALTHRPPTAPHGGAGAAAAGGGAAGVGGSGGGTAGGVGGGGGLGLGAGTSALPRNPRDTIASGSPKRRIQSHKSLPGNFLGASSGGGGVGGASGGAGDHNGGGGGGSSSNIPPPAPPRVVQRPSPPPGPTRAASLASGLSSENNSRGSGGGGGISPARTGASAQPQSSQSSSGAKGQQRPPAISSSSSASGITGMRVVSGNLTSGPLSPAALSTNTSSSSNHIPPIMGSSQIILRSDPDAEEQAMFEQRLCEDEYGVAVRKINSNGKSQLRYVRCVPLVGGGPASPSNGGSGGGPGDGVGGGGGGGGRSTSTRGRGRNKSSASVDHHQKRQRAPSSSRSVSSLMGRIGRSARRDRSQSRDPSLRKGSSGSHHHHHSAKSGHHHRDRSVDRHSSANTDDGSYADASHAEQQAAHLLGGGSVAGLAKRDRALAWGNKKKVRIPLDRFVAVRKGKTTDRTRRNPCPSSRLLSLITDENHSQQCLDIEAPTKLDRDKFARAFAKFLDVPLVTEGVSGQGEGGGEEEQEERRQGGSRSRRGRGMAATVGEERPGTKNYQSMPSAKKSKSKKKLLSSGASAPDLSTSPSTSTAGGGVSSPTSAASSLVGDEGPTTPAALLPALQRAPSSEDDIRFTFSGNRMDSSAASGAGSRQESSVGLGGYLGATGGQNGGAAGRPPRGIATGGALSASGAQSMSSSNAGVVHSMAGSSRNNALLSDAALKRIETEEEEEDGALLLHTSAAPAKSAAAGPLTSSSGREPLSVNAAASASARASAVPTNQAISPSIKISHHHHHHHHPRHAHHGAAADGAAEGGGADDAGTEVSSLTQGFDQEIVEELHQALTELRAELEASRAEAARAVKVAEQAIQSAESCSSNDWNSTVTHKAAEAAAQAQKRSAEAMARQRLAEEKLASERKSAQFWRKQAEAAEEEAGLLTTRAAAAEVQRASIGAELESERRKHAAYTAALRVDYEASDRARREALTNAAERNRIMEMELDGTRKDLAARSEEAKVLHETLSEVSKTTHKGKKMPFRGRKRETTTVTSNGVEVVATPAETMGAGARHLLKVHSEARSMRHELDLLRRTTVDEIGGLPYFAKEWVGKAAAALAASQAETRVLRDKLALESSNRRKLLHEVQDLRGNIRVYCRPRSLASDDNTILSVPSHNIVLLHRDRILTEDSFDNPTSMAPMSFEFDRVFSPGCQQNEVYSEVEELVLGALDGYNVCLMAYGQRGTGKTHTLMGDYEVSLGDDPTTSIDHEGIHMMAAQQLFTIAEHRSKRYQDCFTMTIVEVHNEKLRDMLAGTQIAAERGQVQASPQAKSRSSRSRNARGLEGEVNINSNSSHHGSSAGSKAPQKLEIRTNYDGDSVVQGLVSVDVKSFDDICRIWHECLIERSARLAEKGIDESDYTSESHVIATLSVVSTNITTGIGTTGKIQFVELASSDLESTQRNVPKSNNPTPIEGVLSGVGNTAEWKYKNKSLTTLLDVVNARSQFSRNVPYRNSTVTHLLRDSITSDTKFLLIATVSTDGHDVQNTASALRFASQMRRINIGKATKHTVSLA